MAAGTTGSTSTYSGGSGLSFTKDIASRVVDAAVAAKEEKKHQQSIINDGPNLKIKTDDLKTSKPPYLSLRWYFFGNENSYNP